jgi:hypothetical protein
MTVENICHMSDLITLYFLFYLDINLYIIQNKFNLNYLNIYNNGK